MSTYDIAVIVGSNRRESINRRLAEALVRLARPSLAFRDVRIDDLVIYNGDLEPERTPEVHRFTAEVAKADGLLVLSPEHNRSVTTLLKNAIDWGSKPMEKNVWRDKPVLIAGTSPGAIGTAVGQQHLRQILGILGSIVLGGELYLQYKPELIDDAYRVTNEGTEKFLRGHLERFEQLVHKLNPGR